MKKWLSVVLVIMIVLGIPVITDAHVPAKHHSLKVLQDFSNYQSGTAINSEVVVFTGSHTAVAHAVPKLSGIGGGVALQVNDSVERGFRDGEVSYEIFYPNNTSLTNVDALLLYVKMPHGFADEGVSKLFVNLYTTGNGGDLYSHAGNGKLYILENMSTMWEQRTANNGIIALPDQFEGYIKIPLSELKENAASTFENRTAISTTIKFGSFGGVYGAGYIDAIWAIEDDHLALENELQQGLMASVGQVWQHFSGYEPGNSLRNLSSDVSNIDPPVYINNSATATALAVPSLVSGKTSPSMQLNDLSNKGFDDWVQADVRLVEQLDLTGTEAVMFYVKMPVNSSGNDGTSKLFFNLYSVSQTGSDEKWSNLGDGEYQYLINDEHIWNKANAVSGIAQLPAGFEGYIKVRLADLQTNAPTNGFDNRQARHMSFVFGGFGGNYGEVYLDAISGLTKDRDSLYITVDGYNVYNIIDGKRFAGESLLSVLEMLPPATSASDMALLNNPNRGFRLEVSMNVSNKLSDGHVVLEDDPTEKLLYWHNYYEPESVQLVQTYFYLTGYKDTPIDSYGMNRIQAYFDCLRDLNLQGLIRFVYQTDMDGTGEATEARMLSHMAQLKPLLEANKDVIYVMQAGMIGAWGEWHSHTEPVNMTNILTGVLDMTPETIDVQVRLPEFKNLVSKSDSNYIRIGIHNDSVFGEAAGGTGGVDPGTASWNQIAMEGAFNPVDGELFWGSWSLNAPDGKLLDGYNVIRQLAEHRFSSFSVHHNYREDGNASAKKYSMQYWKEQEIKPEWLTTNGLHYADGWFKNSSDVTISRNIFDYIRDYLGYKLEAKQFVARGNIATNETIDVELSLVNYGFSVPFLMESGFVLLDDSNQVVWSSLTGNPETWYSHSASDPVNKNLLTHRVRTSIMLPSQSGTYRVAFYLQANNDVFAQLGNNLPLVDGYHVLSELVLP